MNDRPTARELIDAVRLYLEKELLPSLSDARLRFQTLVAANVLSVAGRELASEEAMLAEECALLDSDSLACASGSFEEKRRRVEALNAAWCERIRRGDYDAAPRFREAAAVARQLVVRKLEIANPRYLRAVAT